MKGSILQRLNNIERRLSNLNVRGVVSEIDPNMGSGGCIRVLYGDKQLSGWLPVKPLRSGDSSIWWFPNVGEGVTITDLETGEVLPGSFNSDNPPPSRDPDVLYIKFKDDGFISYNQKTGNHLAEFKNNSVITIGGDSTINTTGKVALNSSAKDISLNGGMGVVTGAHVCQLTGKPHSDCSTEVKAAK